MKTKLLKFVCVWQIYAGGIQLSLRWWLLQKPGTSEIQILERIVLHPCNKKKKAVWGLPLFSQPGPQIFFTYVLPPKRNQTNLIYCKKFPFGQNTIFF